MARKRNFRLRRDSRAFAAVALAGPLVALLPQLSPFLSTTAGATAAGPAAAMHLRSAAGPAAAMHLTSAAGPAAIRLTSAQSLARMRAAAGPGKHPATPHPSTSAAAPQPPAGAGGAAAAHAPELSIGVTDGRQHVQSGDLVTYAVKIHNIGKRNIPRLRIVQTLPANMKFISATKHPAAHAGQLTWRLSLAAGHTDKFRVVGRVGQTPGQLLRLATVACADVGASLRPIVCAAHSDELPAGAVAAAHASHAAAASSQPGFVRPLGAALVLAVVAGGCWLVFRRTRRRGRRAS